MDETLGSNGIIGTIFTTTEEEAIFTYGGTYTCGSTNACRLIFTDAVQLGALTCFDYEIDHPLVTSTSNIQVHLQFQESTPSDPASRPYMYIRSQLEGVLIVRACNDHPEATMDGIQIFNIAIA